MRMDRDAQQYVKVGVTKDDADPTDDLTVQMAIVVEGTRPSSYTTASWASSTFTQGGKTYRYAQLLVAGSSGAATGSQDVTLSPSSYPARFDVYVKVTDFPEVPVFEAGVLTVV